MVNEREKLIGARLRAFRESLQIPRARFAVTIGFGSERIASYEAGRAPLLYDVFRSVAKHYRLNALWLAGEEGGPKNRIPFNDAAFIDKISRRALFSEVYDQYLAGELKELATQWKADFQTRMAQAQQLLEELDDESIPHAVRKDIALKLLGGMAVFKESIDKEMDLRSHLDSEISKKPLANVSEFDNIAGVKAKLPALLRRLNEATKERGTKTALAKFMGVPLPRISQWLSGEYEPGGETTLRLLNWVEQRERQK